MVERLRERALRLQRRCRFVSGVADAAAADRAGDARIDAVGPLRDVRLRSLARAVCEGEEPVAAAVRLGLGPDFAPEEGSEGWLELELLVEEEVGRLEAAPTKAWALGELRADAERLAKPAEAGEVDGDRLERRSRLLRAIAAGGKA